MRKKSKQQKRNGENLKYKFLLLYALTCLVVGMFTSEPLTRLIISTLPQGIEFVAQNPTDGFMVLMWVGLAVSFGLLGLGVGVFGALMNHDALYIKEKEFLAKALFPASILFVIGLVGGLLLYTQIILPYFIETNVSLGMKNYFSLYQIITTGLMLSLMLGAIFEIPLILRGLIKLGFIQKEVLKEQRLIIFFGICCLSAIIVPTPDILSSGLVAIPMYGLFEVSLFGL
jgi:Sec-independent protein secretion pathway component TatC